MEARIEYYLATSAAGLKLVLAVPLALATLAYLIVAVVVIGAVTLVLVPCFLIGEVFSD